MVTADRLAAHVERLIAKHKLDVVRLREGANGRAWAQARQVAFPPVRSTVTYGLALHEIGHVVGRGRSGNRLSCEAAAWDWALRNALTGSVDDAFADKVRRSLRSYLTNACSRNGWALWYEGDTPVVDANSERRLGCPALPPPSHDFWHLVEHGRRRHLTTSNGASTLLGSDHMTTTKG